MMMMMRDDDVSSGAEALSEVLAGDDVPWPAFFARSKGETAVEVVALQELGKKHGHEWSEEELDRLVEHLGGRREGTIDPWSWPSRALTRLAGLTPKTTDMYVFPQDEIEQLKVRREK